MDLNELRLEIDKIDDELVRLFVQRMEVSARIADYKKEKGLPILVPSRELEKLQDVAAKAGPDMENYTKVLYNLLFELSRGYQSQLRADRTPLFASISQAIDNTPKLLPKAEAVACVGGEDAQMVCRKFFGDGPVMAFRNADAVLSAVQQGMCRYGILALENGGSSGMKQVYDRLAETGLYVVRAFRGGRRYICVSRQLQIFPGADRSSIMMALSNRPGALYKVLSRLYTLGINVARLESKPMEEKDFQGMFYFDLETSVYSDEFVLLMCELEDLCRGFTYLGSYSEVV